MLYSLMMLKPDTIAALKASLDALDRADPMVNAALPSLARLAQSGQDFEIDLAASESVGAPVVVAHAPEDGLPDLTPRQREIARLLADGMSNKEIARRLDISVATVKDHVHSVLSRLELRRRGEVGALVRGTRK